MAGRQVAGSSQFNRPGRLSEQPPRVRRPAVVLGHRTAVVRRVVKKVCHTRQHAGVGRDRVPARPELSMTASRIEEASRQASTNR